NASAPVLQCEIHACLLCLAPGAEARKKSAKQIVSRKADDGDPHRFEPRDIQNPVAIQIVKLAVGNKVEIRSANRPGGWQYAQLRTIFEDCKLCDADAISGKFVRSNARRTDSVLYRDETPLIPVKAVDTGQRVVRSWCYVNTG